MTVNATSVVEDLVYDVGLHRGEDSAYYMAKGYRVVGFEANPELANVCRIRFGSEIASGQFKLIEGAIDSTGAATVRFFRHPGLSVFGTTDAEWVRRNSWLGVSSVVDVPAVDFAACIRATGMPQFMKVDIEGADRLCYEALRQFSSRPGFVSMESSKVKLASVIDEFDLLESLGYDRFAVVQQARMQACEVATARLNGEPLRYRFEADSSGPFGGDVGPWMPREEAIAKYRRIFRMYQLFGDDSLLRRTSLGRRLVDGMSKLVGVALPGWYDTHARLSGRWCGDCQ